MELFRIKARKELIKELRKYCETKICTSWRWKWVNLEGIEVEVQKGKLLLNGGWRILSIITPCRYQSYRGEIINMGVEWSTHKSLYPLTLRVVYRSVVFLSLSRFGWQTVTLQSVPFSYSSSFSKSYCNPFVLTTAKCRSFYHSHNSQRHNSNNNSSNQVRSSWLTCSHPLES